MKFVRQPKEVIENILRYFINDKSAKITSKDLSVNIKTINNYFNIFRKIIYTLQEYNFLDLTNFHWKNEQNLFSQKTFFSKFSNKNNKLIKDYKKCFFLITLVKNNFYSKLILPSNIEAVINQIEWILKSRYDDVKKYEIFKNYIKENFEYDLADWIFFPERKCIIFLKKGEEYDKIKIFWFIDNDNNVKKSCSHSSIKWPEFYYNTYKKYRKKYIWNDFFDYLEKRKKTFFGYSKNIEWFVKETLCRYYYQDDSIKLYKLIWNKLNHLISVK